MGTMPGYSSSMKRLYSLYFLAFLFLFIAGCTQKSEILIINDAESNPLVQKTPVAININSQPSISPTPDTTPAAAITPTPTPKPKVVLYNVPFAPQAPYAVWDDLHNEACEEASMIMADSFFHKKLLDKDIMENKIQDLVKWEEKNGYTVDVTSDEVVKILMNRFSLNAEVKTVSRADDIISELNRGNLVIIPAAGRLLKNPNYKTPGPLYHMLLVRGYDLNSREIITNDPGTRKGEGYRYPYDVLFNAIHDWPKQGRGKDDVSEEEMNSGQKVMIVVSGI